MEPLGMRCGLLFLCVVGSAMETEDCYASPLDDMLQEDDARAVRFSLMQKSIQPKLKDLQAIESSQLGEKMCNSKPVKRTEAMTCADYDAVVTAVHSLYNKLPTECSASNCPQADFAGCILRSAAHDFMDHRNGLGGMDGCLNLHDSDSRGLSKCLYEGIHGVSLREAYSEWCTQISLPDFLVLSAEAVMNITRQNVLFEDPSRRPLEFRSMFRYGREPKMNCDFLSGELPDAERGCDAVRDTFVSNMQLSWTQAAALMGAHTIGSATFENSGYRGTWTDKVSSRKFDNAYYISMILKGWAPEPAVKENPKKNQWRRVDLGTSLDQEGHEMMLDTDLCLYFTNGDTSAPFRASLAGSVEQCMCTWIRITPDDSAHALNESKGDKQNSVERDAIAKYNNGQMCGVGAMFAAISDTDTEANKFNITKQRIACCSMQDAVSYKNHDIDCGTEGPATDSIVQFAADEDYWLASFHEAWDIAVSRGHSSLSRLTGC